MSEKLLDCPFCGESEAETRQFTSHGKAYWQVRCEECWATSHGSFHLSESGAVEAWNTRAPQSPAPAPSALQPEWQPIKNAPRDRRIEVRYLTDDPRPVQWMATDHGVGWHLANGFGAVPIEFDPTEWRDMVAPSAATTDAPEFHALSAPVLAEAFGISQETVMLASAKLGYLYRRLATSPEPPRATAMTAPAADLDTLSRVIDDTFEALGVTDNEAALVEIDRLKAAATPPSSGNADAVREALVRALIDDDLFGTEASSQEVLEAYAQGSSLVIMDAIRTALTSAPVAGEDKVEKIEAAMKWPAGCHSVSSCERHQRCMYVQCQYSHQDIAKGIAAAKADVLSRNDGGGSAR